MIDLSRPVREIAIEEHETREAVLKEGTRIDESKGTCTAGY